MEVGTFEKRLVEGQELLDVIKQLGRKVSAINTEFGVLSFGERDMTLESPVSKVHFSFVRSNMNLFGGISFEDGNCRVFVDGKELDFSNPVVKNCCEKIIPILKEHLNRCRPTQPRTTQSSEDAETLLGRIFNIPKEYNPLLEASI